MSALDELRAKAGLKPLGLSPTVPSVPTSTITEAIIISEPVDKLTDLIDKEVIIEVTTGTGTTIPQALPALDQVASKIYELQVALQTRAPNYEYLLQTIHLALSKDDEVVTLLTDEQVSVVFSALSKKKGIFLAQSEAKVSKKSLRGTSLEDLGG